LQHLTVSGGTSMIISGANLFIRNGTGSTNTNNGLGNLIIGYNELRPVIPNSTDPNVRTGSHNLVLGARNNYRSYGGIVAGDTSEIGAACASVTGGYRNTASGEYSCVSGGYFSKATGSYASVSGGQLNTAGGISSSVSGGSAGLASGN